MISGRRASVSGPNRNGNPKPTRPGMLADTLVLKGQCEQLLCGDLQRDRWWEDRFDVALAPAEKDRSGSQEIDVARREEQCIAAGVRPTTGTSESLQERSNRGWSVDLDDPIEIADIDTQLQRGGGDDDAVACFSEGRFSGPAFALA